MESVHLDELRYFYSLHVTTISFYSLESDMTMLQWSVFKYIVRTAFPFAFIALGVLYHSWNDHFESKMSCPKFPKKGFFNVPCTHNWSKRVKIYENPLWQFSTKIGRYLTKDLTKIFRYFFLKILGLIFSLTYFTTAVTSLQLQCWLNILHQHLTHQRESFF